MCRQSPYCLTSAKGSGNMSTHRTSSHQVISQSSGCITFILTLEHRPNPVDYEPTAILDVLIRFSTGRKMGCCHGQAVLLDGTGHPKLNWLLAAHTRGSLRDMNFEGK